MQKEVLELANLKAGQNTVDGTLGAGGHALSFLERTGPTGRLLGFEVDETAITMALETLKSFNGRVKIVKRNFREMAATLHEEKAFLPTVDVVFLDLGLSSMLIEQRHKGISFNIDGPLDMRMGAKEGSFDPRPLRRSNLTLEKLREIRGEGLTAFDLVNFLSQQELASILFQHDVRNARQVAKYIVTNREKKRIYTTFDLISAAFQNVRPGRIHPATTTFQALRMIVNREVESLEAALKAGWNALAKNGRLVVLSYHSIEDRTVKQFIKSLSKTEVSVLTKKPLTPSLEEIQNNPRARSAKLRAAKKI